MDLTPIAERWYESYKVEPPERIDYLIGHAEHTAPGFATGGRTSTIVVPGNGYEYRLTLLDVAGSIYPGDLLVAVPHWHRSMVLSLDSLHVPDYVEEKFKLGMVHAVPLAIWLTAFDALVVELRNGKQQEPS